MQRQIQGSFPFGAAQGQDDGEERTRARRRGYSGALIGSGSVDAGLPGRGPSWQVTVASQTTLPSTVMAAVTF